MFRIFLHHPRTRLSPIDRIARILHGNNTNLSPITQLPNKIKTPRKILPISMKIYHNLITTILTLIIQAWDCFVLVSLVVLIVFVGVFPEEGGEVLGFWGWEAVGLNWGVVFLGLGLGGVVDVEL